MNRTFFSILFAIAWLDVHARLSLPPCAMPDSYIAGCIGSIIDKKYGRYEGAIKDRLPNGKGRFEFIDGSSLEGTFKGGLAVGKVVLRDSKNDIRFDGTMTKGTVYFSDGSRYEGDVRNYQPHGKGKMFLSNGIISTGSFENGIAVGRHSGSNSSGAIWQFNIKDGVKTGFASETFEGGWGFFGQYSNNERNGFGTVKFSNGDRYVGGFLNGSRAGWGIYSSASGEFQYIGQFKDNNFSGEAILISNGELIFEGTVSPNEPRLLEHQLSPEASYYIYTQSARDQIKSVCQVALLTDDEPVLQPCIQSMARAIPNTVSDLARARRDRDTAWQRSIAKSEDYRQRNEDRAAELMMRLGAALMGGGSVDVSDTKGEPSGRRGEGRDPEIPIRYTTVRLPNGLQIYCTEIKLMITCR
jgi:hypothetical protein